MTRQGVHGWAKDPTRQEAARKAAATRQRRERAIAIETRSFERREGRLPTGDELRQIIDAVKAADR